MNNTSPASVARAHPLASSYRGFSNPYEQFDEPFFETIATNFAQEAVRLFLQKHADELERKGRGLVSLLQHWLDAETTFDTVWNPAFGASMMSLVGGEIEPAHTAALLALRLCAQGRTGVCEVRLTRPTRLMWHHWLLPRADTVGVESDGRLACLRLRDGEALREVEFRRTEDGCWHGVGAEELPRVVTSRAGVTLLPRDAVSETYFQEIDSLLMENIAGGDIEVCRQALRILEEYAPPYHLWVARIIRQVIPLRAEEAMMRSGSRDNLLGLIHMSSIRRPMPMAEMFVHEASHQYLNLLCRLGPVNESTDATLYYSPAVGRPRPLGRILLAYHAFANMELLYRLCLDGGLDDGGYCAANQAKLLPQLEQLASPLRDNPALTHIGRALFEPLYSRLH